MLKTLHLLSLCFFFEFWNPGIHHCVAPLHHHLGEYVCFTFSFRIEESRSSKSWVLPRWMNSMGWNRWSNTISVGLGRRVYHLDIPGRKLGSVGFFLPINGVTKISLWISNSRIHPKLNRTLPGDLTNVAIGLYFHAGGVLRVGDFLERNHPGIKSLDLVKRCDVWSSSTTIFRRPKTKKDVAKGLNGWMMSDDWWTRWWVRIFFILTPLFGEDFQFD